MSMVIIRLRESDEEGIQTPPNVSVAFCYVCSSVVLSVTFKYIIEEDFVQIIE